MVRSIVGTLVDVGLGKIAPDQMTMILQARSRDAAGQVAPPCGLTLWDVGYSGASSAGSSSLTAESRLRETLPPSFPRPRLT